MLVGRARELARLERALEACVAGRGGMLALCGEAGIGKTRLADEVAERAVGRHRFSVAWGRAWETEGAPPFWPWIECLTTIAERAGEEVEMAPAVRAIVSSAAEGRSSRAGASTGESRGESLRSDPERDRFELFDGVASFLRSAARKTPLLVVLDDLHAADVGSLELLALVARGLRTARIVVLGTYRDVEARRAPVADVLARIAREAEVLPLEPLPREDVAEIVRHELGAFDAGVAARVFDVTDGNPLFVRETLHALALSRDARGGSAVDPIEALRNKQAGGGGVASLVRSRLSGASSETVALLEIGAALGREIEPSLLAAAANAPLDDVMRALRDGAARGIFVTRGLPAERWIFSHVLVREALYRELAPERRRALHDAIARALRDRVERGREQQLATLAHHAVEALPTGRADDVAFAMDVARRAADRARTQLAHEEAMRLLERALTACEAHGGAMHEGHRTELMIALGWAATEAGRLDHGRDVFRQLAAIARKSGDRRLLARAALGQGGVYVLAETRTELVDLLRESLDALAGRDDPEPEDRRLVARLLARLGGALTPSPNPEEPLALARRALAMTEDESDLHTRIDVAVGAGSALIDFSPPAERIVVSERLLQDARRVCDRVLELRALTRLSCDHIEKGDLVNAAAALDAREALGRALESPRYRWQTPLLRSQRAMVEGRWDECEALAAEAHAIATESRGEDPNAARCIAIHRFFLSIVAGRNEHVAVRMADAIRALEPIADRALREWVIATGSAALDERARAIESVRVLLFSSCASKSNNIRTMAANAVAACDAREEAEALREWLAAREYAGFSCWGPFAFVCGPPIAQALAAVAFTCGRYEEGVRCSRDAFAFCTERGARGPEAWVHLTWGEGLCHLRDRVVESRDHLERAIALATELGMPVVAARARTALAKLSEDVTAERVSSRASPQSSPFTIVRTADKWTVTRDGRAFALKDVRGVAMLACLVASPGREVHALELASDPGASDAVVDLGDSGEVIDARAREVYRARIADLRAELEAAESFADHGRAGRARSELDALIEQLAGAVGLGGRERRTGSAAERARITVQRRVREAIKKIADEDAELGRHLDWTIRTGTFCAYEPEGKKTSR